MRSITLPSMKRGDTWIIPFNWSSQSSPIDLTGCSARMQIRNKKTKQLIAETLSSDSTIAIDGPEGKVTATFAADITNEIPPGTYDSDLEITFPVTGRVISSKTIQIVVEEDISR